MTQQTLQQFREPSTHNSTPPDDEELFKNQIQQMIIGSSKGGYKLTLDNISNLLNKKHNEIKSYLIELIKRKKIKVIQQPDQNNRMANHFYV